jgi:hypothetical protein
MNPKWWERPTCFICDYWWVLLGSVVLVLAAYFTRGYWLPMLGFDAAATPTAVSTPVIISTPVSETVAGFVDPQGGYILSYPENWPIQDVGNQAQQWTLPEGGVMSIHSEPIQPGDTLESFAQEVITRLPYDILTQTPVQVGGQPAIRQEVAYPGQSQRVAVGYLVLNGDRKYQIALSGLDGLAPDDQNRVIQEFEQVLATFQFQP